MYYKECKNIKQENLHSKFCKFALRSTNVAVLGELGRYPLLIEVFFTVIKYLNRKIKTEDTLLLEAFNASKSFHRQNKYSWYSNVNNLLKFLNIDIKMLETNKSELKRHIYRKLKLKYDNLWRSEINYTRENNKFGNKLRTYCSFKNNIIL